MKSSLSVTFHFIGVLVFLAAVFFQVSAASATDGYFQHGYGARQKALGGAGVADGRDATSAALNPAGLVHVGEELDVSVSVFSPRRSVTGSGQPGFTPLGEIESGSEYFAIPNLAWSTKAYANPLFDVVALTMYGNGGMNTDYKDFARAPNECLDRFNNPIGTRTGVFCFGAAGVNFNQAFLSVAFAKEVAPGVSIGVAPILAYQQIELVGIDAFSALSNDPSAVSGAGTDRSFGGGVRAGIEFSPLDNVRIGVAGNSRILMQRFDKYRGLFAEQGGFDIPPSVQAGIAVDVSTSLTLMVDYKHIWYSTINSIANPSTNGTTCNPPAFEGPGGPTCLGGDDGPGFGWDDISIIKVGAEWQATDVLTLRAGYSWNQSPIQSRDVMFNIIAPGIVQHHITGGFKYQLDTNYALEVTGMYVPSNSVSGAELAQFGNANHRIELEMYQFEVTAGVVYTFGP